MASECVKVIVRCRPMNKREFGLSCKTCIGMENTCAQVTITNPRDLKGPPKNFTFDGAYFTESTTENIYNEIAYPLVEGVTEGYNGTIFAYGQTGCGKSFTMQGITDPVTQRGIIPRAFDHVFETVSCADNTKFLIHASYCEIYNEDIRDLLGKDTKAKLELHEHPERGVYVNGLSPHPVHNVVECEKIMDKGWKNRATGETLMNTTSSRSHSIFTINMEMMTLDDEGEEHIRAGKLNLVDLAGSERQAKTGSTGDRLKEATKINLSLSALGNVISALVDAKSTHIPYRDSKLTRLLQDSLGGNTKTLMVACVSPADNNYDESLSTLRYANRAKNIKNKPKINEDPKDALLRQYQEEIQKLKAMLMGQLPIPEGGFSDLASVGSSTSMVSDRNNDQAREELEHEKARIREEYDSKLRDMQNQYEQEKVSKAKLQQDMAKLRSFYDDKLHTVEGQIESLPCTAEKRQPAENMKMMAFRNLMEMFKTANGTKSLPRSQKDKGEVESSSEDVQTLANDSLEVDGKGKKKGGKSDAAVTAASTTDGSVVVTDVDGSTLVKHADGSVTKATSGGLAVKHADGLVRDADGNVESGTEIRTVAGTEGATRTEYMEVDSHGVPLERPQSVAGEELPPGPDVDISTATLVATPSGLAPTPSAIAPTQAHTQTAIEAPSGDKVIMVNGQMVRQSGQQLRQSDDDISIQPAPDIAPASSLAGEAELAGPVTGSAGSRRRGKRRDDGSQAPASSPTHLPLQEQLMYQKEEAMKRLHELECQMVGGENMNNTEVKDRRFKRKRFAEERKRNLADAIAKMDDDGIMLQIYDNIGDELKVKNKKLQKEKEKNEALNVEILDIQSEFEFEKIDYLDTIRKQEKELKLFYSLLERIQPCVRRDCNYSNLDRIKIEAKWDEEEQTWVLPKLYLEKTALPAGTKLPGGMGGSRSPMMNGEVDDYDDRFREKIMRKQDKSGQYFQTKRQSQLVNEPLSKVNMQEVKQSYGINPVHTLPVSNGFTGKGTIGDNMSSDLKAAHVHGQIMSDEGMLRKPKRLEALQPLGKKSRKKNRNNFDGM